MHATFRPVFHDPLPLKCGYHIWKLPNPNVTRGQPGRGAGAATEDATDELVPPDATEEKELRLVEETDELVPADFRMPFLKEDAAKAASRFRPPRLLTEASFQICWPHRRCCSPSTLCPMCACLETIAVLMSLYLGQGLNQVFKNATVPQLSSQPVVMHCAGLYYPR